MRKFICLISLPLILWSCEKETKDTTLSHIKTTENVSKEWKVNLFHTKDIPTDLLKNSKQAEDIEGESVMQLIPSIKDFEKDSCYAYIDLSLKKMILKVNDNFQELKEKSNDHYENDKYSVSLQSHNVTKLPDSLDMLGYAVEGKMEVKQKSNGSIKIIDFFSGGL